MIRPEGNEYGLFMIALDAREEAESLKYTADIYKLTANQGFKGDEKTPGIVQSYATQRASMMDLDYLLQSKDLNEFFGSVIDAFINRIIREGLSSMETDSYQPKGQPPQVTLPQPEIDLVYVKTNYQVFQWLKDDVGLIFENLNNLLTQQKKNLELMEQIKAQQDAATACGKSLATPSIDAELTQIKDEIAKNETKISQANSTIPVFAQLLATADAVIAADKNGDQAAVEKALQDFKNQLSLAISSLQALIETTETDPEQLHYKTGDYSLEIVQQETEYFERLGHRKDKDPDSLYSQLDEEKTHASSFCSLCKGGIDCSDACLAACSKAGY